MTVRPTGTLSPKSITALREKLVRRRESAQKTLVDGGSGTLCVDSSNVLYKKNGNTIIINSQYGYCLISERNVLNGAHL